MLDTEKIWNDHEVKTVTNAPRQTKTPAYRVFYILFSPDTWRILIGFAASVRLAPSVAPPDLALSGRAMLYVMVAAIGWAASGKPAGWIVSCLKKIFLGK